MVVCQFYLRDQCKFGASCRNEHPDPKSSGFGNNSAWGSSNTASATTSVTFNVESIQRDFGPAEKPLWLISSYGPGRYEPTILAGLDMSPEELRARAVEAMKEGKVAEYSEFEATTIANANAQYARVAGDVKGTFEVAFKLSKLASEAAVPTPAAAPSTSAFEGGGTSTFGSSTFEQPSISAFGQSAFGQSKPVFGTSAFGQPAASTSAFGQPAAITSAFGQSTSAFGSTSTAPAFGQSAFGASAAKPAFGAFTFGQPTASAFGASVAPSSSASRATTSTPAFGSFTTQSLGSSTTAPAFGASTFGSSTATNPLNSAGGLSAIANNGPTTLGASIAAPSNPFGQSQAILGETPLNASGAPMVAFGQPAMPTTNLFGQSPAAPQAQANPLNVMPAYGEKKYTGTEKIVIGMDIGTTHSAVSFAYFYPDDIPRVRMVNKWPGQPESVGSSKIPTIVAYRNGECKACGAEARDYENDTIYSVAKWFKLHLHPSSMKLSDLPPPYGSPIGSSAFEVPPLPEMVSTEKVYTDFMKYLIDNTQVVFGRAVPNGEAVWKRLRSKMVVVLTTPNGWDFAQQSILRKAAIAAGVVEDQTANELLDFVTEGEASVHYALAYSQTKSWLRVNSIFAVIDAGGSTVDSTLYECKATDPKVLLEEVCPSECIQAGGVFVDRAAEVIFNQRLRGSHFGDEECIADMVAAFESRTKRLFDGDQASYVVDFGGSRDTDRVRGIIKGKLSMTNEEVCSAFDDVIKRIMDNCSLLLRGRKVQHIILVGGFGESAYLQKKLVELFDAQGAKVVTVEEPAKKAAAEGSLIWYIKQTVLARIARATIGARVSLDYRPEDPEHQRRIAQVFTSPSGTLRVRGGFGVVLSKGARMGSDFSCSRGYMKSFSCRVIDSLSSLDSFECELEIWEGEGSPTWVLDVFGNRVLGMRSLCTLKANLSPLRNSLKVKGPPHKRYCEVAFRVAIQFGGTQLQARLEWEEGSITRQGPVSILPSSMV